MEHDIPEKTGMPCRVLEYKRKRQCKRNTSETLSLYDVYPDRRLQIIVERREKTYSEDRENNSYGDDYDRNDKFSLSEV